MKTANLSEAYEGSYYTICGAGGDLAEWQSGITEALKEIGIPTGWCQTTGGAINEFAATKGTVTNPFKDDLTVIMFASCGEGMDTGKLALFKLQMGDRWFDDIVDNMVTRTETYDYEYDEED